MQTTNSIEYSKYCDQGRIRPGDVVHDDNGVAYIAMREDTNMYIEGNYIFRVSDARIFHCSYMAFPVGVGGELQ